MGCSSGSAPIERSALDPVPQGPPPGGGGGGQPLFPHPGSRREGFQDPAHPSRPGARAARHRPHRRLPAAGPRALRAGVPHAPGPAAEGAAARRDRQRGGGHPLPARGLSARARRPLRVVRREQPAPAFVKVPAELWREVLCVQAERRVGNGNCGRWRGRVLQIPPSPLRPHFVRATARLHGHPDGAVTIFAGPHRLASFAPAAEPSQDLAA